MALKPEGEYELFGGNVRGKVQAVEQPTKLVQTWQTRNGKWPTGPSFLSDCDRPG